MLTTTDLGNLPSSTDSVRPVLPDQVRATRDPYWHLRPREVTVPEPPKQSPSVVPTNPEVHEKRGQS